MVFLVVELTKKVVKLTTTKKDALLIRICKAILLDDEILQSNRSSENFMF